MNVDRLVGAKVWSSASGLIVCGLSVFSSSTNATAGSGTPLSSDTQLAADAAEAA